MTAGQALAWGMDACRCKACGWVRKLASCFPELCRCVWAHYVLWLPSLTQWQMLWDVTIVATGEGKPGAEDFGTGPCCKCGSTFRYMQKAGVCLVALPFFSMIITPKLNVYSFFSCLNSPYCNIKR